MRSFYIPFLVAARAAYALARHGHPAHMHHIPHAKMLEPRDLAWLDTGRIPVEFYAEFQTATATVFEDCTPPTNTVYTTTTVYVNLKPETISFSHMQPHPTKESKPEPTTTVFMTRTVTKTTTEMVDVSAEPTSTLTGSSSESTQQRCIYQTTTLDLIPPSVPLPTLPHLLPDPATLPSSLAWTSAPTNGDFSTKGFGARTEPKDTKIQYRGNVGVPWGSNIISVSPTESHRYKYVVQFTGSNTEPWMVVIWNKVGPDGKMDGWYSHTALRFILAPGEMRYVAFDEDSEGAWGAAPSAQSLPIDPWGGYSCTWGEFSFGDVENGGWSGWDVSAIQAQIAHQHVQGMRICKADGEGCSIIEPGARKVVNAYTKTKRKHDGIGGAAPPGPVRLEVQIDYHG